MSDNANFSTEAIEGFASLYGHCIEAEQLSTSNNTVYRIRTTSGEFAVKEVADPTVDAQSEQLMLRRLGCQSAFRPVLDVIPIAQNRRFVAVSPYIAGESLDSVLAAGDYGEATALQWARQLESMFGLIAGIPAVGFGRAVLGGDPTFKRWSEFLDWYLLRQRDKGPILAKLWFDRLWSAFEHSRDALDDAVPSPRLLSADVNARNYLVVGQARDLVCIHTPILWHGDPAVSYGEAFVHLDSTPIADALRNGCAFPDWRLHFYSAFSAYVILAYVERYDPTPLDQAVAWGGKRPLMRLLAENLLAVEDWHVG